MSSVDVDHVIGTIPDRSPGRNCGIWLLDRSPISQLTCYLLHPPPLRATPLHTMPLVGGLEERTFEDSTLMLYARASGDVLEPNETQRNTLIAAGVYILVIGILWYVMCRV